MCSTHIFFRSPSNFGWSRAVPHIRRPLGRTDEMSSPLTFLTRIWALLFRHTFSVRRTCTRMRWCEKTKTRIIVDKWAKSGWFFIAVRLYACIRSSPLFRFSHGIVRKHVRSMYDPRPLDRSSAHFSVITVRMMCMCIFLLARRHCPNAQTPITSSRAVEEDGGEQRERKNFTCLPVTHGRNASNAFQTSLTAHGNVMGSRNNEKKNTHRHTQKEQRETSSIPRARARAHACVMWCVRFQIKTLDSGTVEELDKKNASIKSTEWITAA